MSSQQLSKQVLRTLASVIATRLVILCQRFEMAGWLPSVLINNLFLEKQYDDSISWPRKRFANV